MQKECTKCKVVYSLDNFHKNSKAKYGRASNCKKCRAVTCKRHRESSNYYKDYYIILFYT